MIQSLFKRSGTYFGGLVFGKGLATLLFILYARLFTPDIFGEYVFYYTILSLTTLIADFGLIQWYQKIHHSRKNKEALLHEMLSARTITLVLSIAFTMLIFYFSDILPKDLLILLIATLIPEAYQSVLDGYYLAEGKSPKVSLKNIIKMGIQLVMFFILRNTMTLQLAIILFFMSSVFTLWWYIPVTRLTGFSFSSLKTSLANLKSSAKYAYLIATSYVYSRGDSIIIKLVHGSSAIGLYGGAYRYLESLSLLPTALQQNLFPIAAKEGSITLSQLKKITQYMTVIGIIMGLLLYVLSDFLIVGLLGQAYQAAIPLLHIFSCVLVLFFVNSPLSSIVQSSNLMKKFLPYGIMNTIINIGLNIMLIPMFGFVAAAWIMLFTEVTGLFINLHFVKKIYTS